MLPLLFALQLLLYLTLSLVFIDSGAGAERSAEQAEHVRPEAVAEGAGPRVGVV